MHKRAFLRLAATGAAAALGAAAARSGTDPETGHGSGLLTVGGSIGRPNRGPADPAFDRLLVNQGIRFQKARVFDCGSLAGLPAVSIGPTLEYDGRRHTLRGPLLLDVIRACGVEPGAGTRLLVQAVDGYAAQISVPEALQRRFILATHLDRQPLALGGLGPLWTIYDADRFADQLARPLAERFALCPWATYYIDVRENGDG
jgi:hypothetical protein